VLSSRTVCGRTFRAGGYVSIVLTFIGQCSGAMALDRADGKAGPIKKSHTSFAILVDLQVSFLRGKSWFR
jgi:hypothetical protein